MSEAITLYTGSTPNGYKVTVLLELLGLKYNVEPIDIRTNKQKEPWYLEMNPNGRIPTLVDKSTGITISETAAIMTYLVDTYDKEKQFSLEHGTPEYYKHMEILYFQMAGIGPMQGQAHHFVLYAPEKIPYGMKRYTDETKRLYGVLNDYLDRNKENGPYLVSNHITIADIALLTWATRLPLLSIDVKEFPLVRNWMKNLLSNPKIDKGFQIPSPPPNWPLKL